MANIGDILMRFLAEFDKGQVVKAAEGAGNIAGQMFGTKLKGGIGVALTDFGNSAMKIGKGTTKVGDAMARNVTLPILAAGGATAKLALDFNTAMNQIVGLAKVPRDQIRGIGDNILKMAGDVGRSPEELAQAFYFVASAGFNADEAMKVLEISAKAAASGMGETQDIAKTLGGVLNAYGHGNITAAHAADVLTAAVQDGAAEAVDFANSIGQVVPNASAMGVSFDQVAAAMAAMTNVGVDADTAATNLSQIFTSLLKPTSQAEDALKGVGLSSAGLRQELKDKGLLATLRTLQGAFEGNDTAIAQVFGNIRALRGVNALLAQDQSKLTGVFNDTAGAIGNLQQVWDDTDGPQRQLDKSMGQLKASAIIIGNDVLPVVVDVLHELAGGVQEFAKWWTSLSPELKHSIVQWAAWLAVAGPLLSMIGRVTTGIGGLAKGVGFLATKMPLLSAGIKTALGPLGWLLAIVQGANLAADAGTKALGVDYVGAVQKAAFATGDFSGAMGDLLKAQDASGKSAAEFQTKVAEGIQSGLSWADAIKAATKAFAGIPPATRGAVDGMTSAFDRGAAVMDATVSGFSTGVKNVTATTKTDVQQMTDEEIAAAQKAREQVLQSVKDLFKDLTTVLTNRKDFDAAWQGFLDELTNPWSSTSRRLAIEAELASKSIQEGLTNKDPKIKQDSIDLVNNLIGQYELLAPGALGAGKEVNPKLKAGIDGNVNLAITAAQAAADKAGIALDMTTAAGAAGLTGIQSYINGVRAKDREATDAAAGVRLRVTKELMIDLTDSGSHVADSWVDGMVTSLNASGHRISKAAALASLGLRGFSPPKEGPLRDIDKWGYNVGAAWTGAFVQAIGGMNLNAALGGFASRGLSGLSVPSVASAGSTAGLGGITAAAPVAGAPTINVHLEDRIPVRTVEDIGYGLKRLGDMGKLALPGARR